MRESRNYISISDFKVSYIRWLKFSSVTIFATCRNIVWNHFFSRNLNSSTNLYNPILLPQCFSPSFFCLIWVPLIGGGCGFPVIYTTLKKSVSAHFIFFKKWQNGLVYLNLQTYWIHTYLPKELRNKKNT